MRNPRVLCNIHGNSPSCLYISYIKHSSHAMSITYKIAYNYTMCNLLGTRLDWSLGDTVIIRAMPFARRLSLFSFQAPLSYWSYWCSYRLLSLHFERPLCGKTWSLLYISFERSDSKLTRFRRSKSSKGYFLEWWQDLGLPWWSEVWGRSHRPNSTSSIWWKTSQRTVGE